MGIIVRPYKSEYAEVHYQAVKASIDSLKEWFSFAKPDYCLCDSIRFIRNIPNQPTKHEYAIFDSDDGQFLGSCCVEETGCKRAVLRYWRRSDTIKGHIISETIKVLKKTEFSRLDLDCVTIDIADCNIGSIKAAKDAGAMEFCEKDVAGAGGVKKHLGKTYVIDLRSRDKG